MAAKRLLVSLEQNIFEDIETLAIKRHKSISGLAKELIVSSLELDEDLAISKLADERLKNTKNWVNHTDAWK